MTASNSDKMTMEERLAIRLRQSDVGDFFTPEDMDGLAKRAIAKAFFEPGTKQEGYHTITTEATVITLARAAFDAVLTERVKVIAAQLVETEAFRDALIRACLQAIPAVLSGQARQIVAQSFTAASLQAHKQLEEELRAIVPGRGMVTYPPYVEGQGEPIVGEDGT